ncbi:MAG: hypothetical protein ACI4F9_04115 [Lachnospiraceae bacterium]
MNELVWEREDRLSTHRANKITIKEKKKSTCEYDIYIVKYGETIKEFRWFKKSLENKEMKQLYGKIIPKITKEDCPDNLILWPLDIVGKSNQFGYIRESIGDEYEQFLEIVNGREKLPYKKKIDIALQIVYAYKLLGEEKLLYSSLAESIWVNKSTGKIMIEDIIEVEEREKLREVYPRFVAPEIVEGAESDIYSHRFSLAIILFMLLCNGHPLEGKKSVVPCISSNLRKELYGEKASFIMGNAEDNAPDEIIHADVKKIWKKMPIYIKELFRRDFSESGIKNPETRVTEQEWFIALTRFRSDIIKCQYCSNEALTVGDGRDGTYICDACKKETKTEFELDLGDYSIPWAVDSRIYYCQIDEECNAKDALKAVAKIIANKANPKMLGIKNMGEEKWNAKTSAGQEKIVTKNDPPIPLKQNISFEVYGKEIKVKKKL